MSKWEAEEWEQEHTATDLGDLAEVEDGPLFPKRLHTRFRHDRRAVIVTMRFGGEERPGDYIINLERTPDSGPTYARITDVQVHTDEVGLTSGDLRDIPLGEMATHMLTSYIVAAEGALQLSLGEMLEQRGVPDVPAEVREAWPHGDRDLVYKWVDLVYTAALMLGKPPTKTVGEKFKVNPTTGARLVKYAREAGVLTASSVNDPRRRKKRGHEQGDDG